MKWKKWRSRESSFCTIESQLINRERKKEIETHHQANTKGVTVAGKTQKHMLKLASKSLRRKWIYVDLKYFSHDT